MAEFSIDASASAPDVSINMSLHLGDVMRETAHLAPAEMGAHMRLCMAAWSRGGYLPREPERLRRLAGVDSSDWPAIWDAIGELWEATAEGSLICHRRTLEEIERARARKASYRARGKLGGRPAKAQRKLSESSALAEGKADAPATTKLSDSADDRSDSPAGVSIGIPEAEESSALAEGEAGGKPPTPTPDPESLSPCAPVRVAKPKPSPEPKSAFEWLCFFKAKWTVKHLGRQYGKGEADAKASARLGDLLGSLPEEQRRSDWDDRERIVDEFLAADDERTIRSGHSFAFFATAFRGLAVPPEERPRHSARASPGNPRVGSANPEDYQHPSIGDQPI